MSEHRLVPWEVEDGVYVVEVASRDIVASCEVDFPRDVQESNARFAAAAPDLLAVLEKMRSQSRVVWMTMGSALRLQCEAAITKARGEGSA